VARQISQRQAPSAPIRAAAERRPGETR
jgi:hypothetical protein